MDDVNRWDFDLRDGLRIVDNGDWVRHDDHEYAMGKAADALADAQATIARLEALLVDVDHLMDDWVDPQYDTLEAAQHHLNVRLEIREVTGRVRKIPVVMHGGGGAGGALSPREGEG